MGVCCSKEVNNIKNVDNNTHNTEYTSNPLPKTIEATTKIKTATIQQQYTRDDILFINYDELTKLNQLPCYPDYCVNVNSIDRSKAMFIYVSHNWIRRSSSTQGWMTKNHPDND